MANYKKVDADKLDAGLTSVADAIRERAGTTEPLAFPEEYESVVRGIPDFLEQRMAGTIEEYSNDRVKTLPGTVFVECKKLARIHLPKVEEVGGMAFQNCEGLVKVNVDSAKNIGYQSFAQCSNLKMLRLPSVEYMSSCALMNTKQLKALILPNEDVVCSLENADALNYGAIYNGTGYTYVPRALVDSYKAATNWSPYSTQFKILEDCTVDGTTTGEFDFEKAGYTKLSLDGTQGIAIPDWGGNPSGVNGCTHFEYILPPNINPDSVIAPYYLRNVDFVGNDFNAGVSNIYSITQWNGNYYLGVSMDSDLLGTTVESIKAYLSANNMVFYTLPA